MQELRQFWSAMTSRAWTWRTMRGPFSTARLELERLGWKLKEFGIVTTDLGTDLCFMVDSPARVKEEAMAAARRRAEQRLPEKWYPVECRLRDPSDGSPVLPLNTWRLCS